MRATKRSRPLPSMQSSAFRIIPNMAKAYRHISQPFEPVFNERSRVLVLGSFPSEISRQAGFYYGNPRNRFWEIVARCTNSKLPQKTKEKAALLLENGIALWDVIESCDIKGSSDASIKNVQAADLNKVLSKTCLDAIICNGNTAGRLFKKYLQYLCKISPVTLPSTSPANAKWSITELENSWGEHLVGIKPLSDQELLERKGSDEYTYMFTRLNAPTASNYAVHKSMQGNKRKDTKPELIVRSRLQEAGLGGYRLQWKVPGRPDIAWPGKKVALFINGCFWHRCPHCSPSTPKKNVEYWQKKFKGNQERDKRNLQLLADAGWTTHVIWECELKKDKREETFAVLFPQLSEELGKELRLNP